jgi:hypothetical protein
MAKNRNRKNHVQDTPIVEPKTETVTTETKTETVTTETLPENATNSETVTTETAPVEVKAKKRRYAPTSVLVDSAVITSVKANPKRVGSRSFDRYAKFYRVGMTVAEYIADNKAAGLPGMLARNDLRWDLEHGHIEIGAPAPAEQPETETTES